jgi:hypothetical protein
MTQCKVKQTNFRLFNTNPKSVALAIPFRRII